MCWPILAFLIAFHFCGLGTSAALSETRIALVIGNGKYKHASPLINPVNDANDVAAALRHTKIETHRRARLG